ncbi:hypothetical protein KDA_65010 [Dictyobacter alpinus]|uniref:PsbP C-terminal domain-containing protein n=1 Tax=Dictyobacter alpinus TaxID=2014873 RepID=A0A402BIE3_9CHLR|nr:hypothetical protein [Dictyobacter alpinus]GCE31017.1 hypothetical protein KDA_65010 [Dictyobacter alpinus]
MLLSRRMQFYAVCLYLFFCVIFLAGCSSSVTAMENHSTPTPTPTKIIPTPTPLPTPTPTPAIPQKNYSDHNFSLSYPKAWTVKEEQNERFHVTTITAPGDSDDLTIVTSGPLSSDLQVNLKTGIDNQLKLISQPLTNVEDTTISPTTTFGGLTWQQKSIRGDYTANNDTYAVYYTLWGTVHPKYGVFYITTYTSADDQDLSDKEYFQPMMHSFQFTDAKTV